MNQYLKTALVTLVVIAVVARVPALNSAVTGN